jgi:DNA-directed RNA polymerase subunit beta'
MGAEAIQEPPGLQGSAESDDLHDQIANGKGQKKIRAIKLRVINSCFLQTGNSPAAMVLEVAGDPTGTSPMGAARRWTFRDLRPLDLAPQSDYSCNNRLQHLLDLGTRVIVSNELACCRRPSAVRQRSSWSPKSWYRQRHFLKS